MSEAEVDDSAIWPPVEGNARMHFVQICQFGQDHGQCRCPGPKRRIAVDCDRPGEHDESIDYIGGPPEDDGDLAMQYVGRHRRE